MRNRGRLDKFHVTGMMRTDPGLPAVRESVSLQWGHITCSVTCVNTYFSIRCFRFHLFPDLGHILVVIKT